MKLLVVGGGGREHAIIKKLKENPTVEKIYAIPGNGGIARDAVCVPEIGVKDIEKQVEFAIVNGIDYRVIAPDDPLALGAVDAFEKAGIPAFGPRANRAIIEASKIFSKNLMKKYHIPTAKYETFDSMDKALAYLDCQKAPIVVKADGLALGKGVIIAETIAQAKDAVKMMMEEGAFGASGSKIVIEEFLTGPEVSVLAFTDGKVVKPMVSSMDHKRSGDNDTGLNTGGMGTIAPNPFYTKEIADRCMQEIFIPTIAAMNAEGRTFKGCLYFGLMLTPDGPKVIEYNARFGDPETQVVLPRLKTDFVDVINAVIDEKLDELEIEWIPEACACVVMASGGYPQSYPKGLEITGLDENGQAEGVTVYHAGTKLENGKLLTNGGRVLGVTATAKTLDEALEKAYAAVEKIHFDGAHYRHDIGRTK